MQNLRGGGGSDRAVPGRRGSQSPRTGQAGAPPRRCPPRTWRCGSGCLTAPGAARTWCRYHRRWCAPRLRPPVGMNHGLECLLYLKKVVPQLILQKLAHGILIIEFLVHVCSLSLAPSYSELSCLIIMSGFLPRNLF